MEISLGYVSDSGYQSGIAKDIGVERRTVSKTFSTVLDQIVAKSENIEQAKTD